MYDLAIPFEHIHQQLSAMPQRYLPTHTHCFTAHNSQETETAYVLIYRSEDKCSAKTLRNFKHTGKCSHNICKKLDLTGNH